jgi:hypothetical protein
MMPNLPLDPKAEMFQSICTLRLAMRLSKDFDAGGPNMATLRLLPTRLVQHLLIISNVCRGNNKWIHGKAIPTNVRNAAVYWKRPRM